MGAGWVGRRRREISLLQAVITVFLPFAGGYFLSYLYRSVNAVIAGRLTGELSLDASNLGLLTSAYFLAFASFQLPLGILLDRFGPRRVQACLLLVAAAGALVFSLGQSMPALIAGRMLIGFGVAGGLMGSFKAITLWFPNPRWPLVNGCFLGMGGLGAMAATAPVEMALQVTDWRGVFQVLAAATVAVSLVIVLVVPEKQGVRAAAGSLREQLRALAVIYGNRRFWAYAPMAVIGLANGMAVQGLWSGPWFRDVGGHDQATVAAYLLAVAAAMTFGFVANGVVTDLLVRRGVGLTRIMRWGVLLYLLAQAAIVARLLPDSPIFWMLFGMLSNVAMLTYPLLSQSFPLEFAGRVNTAINVIVFFLAFSIQYAVGGLLDLVGPAADGRYSGAAYSFALGVMLAAQVAGYLWFLVATRRES